MARESLGALTFFIQRCYEPVHITICSAKTLICHVAKFLLLGLTVQVPTKNMQKTNYAVVFGLVDTIRAMKLKLKLTATTFTKVSSPQINYNMKETSLRLYEKECAM